MDGNAVKAMRRRAGMSQAEFGVAIGLSRETIGRMERGSEVIDRRTELAMRYVAERGPTRSRSLGDVHREVTNILDEASVRGRPSLDGTRQLQASAADWIAAGGSPAGAALLNSAQGTIGMLNVTSEGDPLRNLTFADLRELKLAWRAVVVTPETNEDTSAG